MRKKAVVALGGNAIIQKGEKGDIHQQFANTRKTLDGIMELIERNYDMVITHGNGPQVGNLFLMVEASRGVIEPLPLGVLVADTQGQMGYMIQQSLQNRLTQENLKRLVATVITQIIVDKNDPSFDNPTKPVGPFYTAEEADKIINERGWNMVEDSGRGYRLVVASPKPQEVVEIDTIRNLLREEAIVIAAGGGGIPVMIEEDGTFEGVDAVVDKDYASSVLARDLEADLLLIQTGVDKVSLNYNTPEQENLDVLTIDDAKKYLAEGQFPPGSMGPKIEAAIQFLESGGKEVIITSIEKVGAAIDGNDGTRIIK
jgi:carbamate kinase